MNYSITIQKGRASAPMLYYTRSFLGALCISGFHKILGAKEIKIQREEYVWKI